MVADRLIFLVHGLYLGPNSSFSQRFLHEYQNLAAKGRQAATYKATELQRSHHTTAEQFGFNWTYSISLGTLGYLRYPTYSFG